jgi:hypothetical protein
MSEHPAVVFLRQAHEQAEELARVATPGPWMLNLDDETITSEFGTVARLRDFVRLMTNAQVEADARLITGMADPAAVLRRVAADREQLAEHADRQGECRVCAAEGEFGGIAFLGNVPWPCGVWLRLAEGWGWTVP